MNILVSACLLGIPCRYDAASKPNKKILEMMHCPVFHLIPFCPEMLGGLPTPRPPCELSQICGELKSLTKDCVDRTSEYKKGARESLKIAKLFDCKFAVLKEKSPSCGSSQIYDGTFSNHIVKGEGMTAKVFRENGIKVLSEFDLIELNFDFE